VGVESLRLGFLAGVQPLFLPAVTSNQQEDYNNFYRSVYTYFYIFLYTQRIIFVILYNVDYYSSGREAMHIGERVQREREKHGWSQNELATKARIKQPVISRLESHIQQSVSSDALKRLARVLGVSADYLIGMYEEEESAA
jgi:plasmid maintenance system antidote protein VapI